MTNLTNLTQKQRVEKRLREMKVIYRNECLRNYISRLGAIINQLKNEGWEFEAERWRGDYRYFATDIPPEQKTLQL